MQWTGWGLAALIFLVMGTCGFLDCHRMMTECPEQEEDKDSEEVIDELWRWVSLFLGGIYFMFLAVFFLGVGRLLPLSLNTLGIMATFVIIVPGPLLIAYFSGSIFGSSHAKTENHDPEPYDGFAEEHCPGFDEFEADDDDFVDDDFEGREAEEE